MLVMAPIAAGAVLSAAAVADLIPSGDGRFAALTAGVAIVVGIAALVAGLLRLGFVAHFISPPVLRGFIIGLALTIIVGQLPKLFGLHPTCGDLFEQAWRLITHLGDT
jgi:sulfate permease, SulP family